MSAEMMDFLLGKIDEADSLEGVNAVAREHKAMFDLRLTPDEQKRVREAADRRRGFLSQHPGGEK